MIEWFLSLTPVSQAFLATMFTWLLTAAGAAVVFGVREVNKKFLDSMLGFAAGVMIAASFWSLLAPGIELAETMYQRGDIAIPAWLLAAIGFIAGGLFMRLADLLLPHIHPALDDAKAEGLPTQWKRSTLLVLAITLHNIPEGLAVGIAFGAIGAGIPHASIGSAIALALGIGLQNFPEGMAVSLPLRREGLSRMRSFTYGQLSGIVEVFAGVAGAAFVLLLQPILPWALCFAAGAMIFIVVEELIPESQRIEANIDTVTMATMFGFATMMMLDVALG